MFFLVDVSSRIFNAELKICSALKILEDVSTRKNMMHGYKSLKDKLGKPGVTDRASKDILDLLVQ